MQWNAKSKSYISGTGCITLTNDVLDARQTMMNSAGRRDPPQERKDYGAPVGLRNLGATCYVSVMNFRGNPLHKADTHSGNGG